MKQEIFPTTIWHSTYPYNIEAVAQAASTVQLTPDLPNQVSMRQGLCSYNYIRNLHTRSEFATLKEWINQEIQLYWQNLGYDSSRSARIKEMWLNVYPPGSWIDIHDHAPAPVVGTFYVQCEPGKANLILEHPLNILLKHQPLAGLRDRGTYHDLNCHEISITTGDLVLFPGYLNHRSRPNSHNKDRIMIGVLIEQDFRARINDRYRSMPGV